MLFFLRTELVLAVTFLVLVVLIFVGWELFFPMIILLFLYFLGKTFHYFLICCKWRTYHLMLSILQGFYCSIFFRHQHLRQHFEQHHNHHHNCRQYHRQRLTSVQFSICSRFICYKCERALDHTKQPVIFEGYKSFWTSTNFSTFAKCSFSF